MTHGYLSSSRVLTVIVCSAMLFLPVGCAQMRQLTYPSDFKWIDDSDVQTTMQAMAGRLYRLDRLVTEKDDRIPEGSPSTDTTLTDSVAEDTRAQVLNELEGIEALASTLLAGGGNAIAGEEATIKTNHLLLDEHLDDFIAQLNHARWQVEAEPPSYYGVGKLTGSCTACHQMRN